MSPPLPFPFFFRSLFPFLSSSHFNRAVSREEDLKGLLPLFFTLFPVPAPEASRAVPFFLSFFHSLDVPVRFSFFFPVSSLTITRLGQLSFPSSGSSVRTESFSDTGAPLVSFSFSSGCSFSFFSFFFFHDIKDFLSLHHSFFGSVQTKKGEKRKNSTGIFPPPLLPKNPFSFSILRG